MNGRTFLLKSSQARKKPSLCDKSSKQHVHSMVWTSSVAVSDVDLAKCLIHLTE